MKVGTTKIVIVSNYSNEAIHRKKYIDFRGPNSLIVGILFSNWENKSLGDVSLGD